MTAHIYSISFVHLSADVVRGTVNVAPFKRYFPISDSFGEYIHYSLGGGATVPQSDARHSPKAGEDEECRTSGVPHAGVETGLTTKVADLKQIVKEHIKGNIQPMLVALAQEKGLELHFTPPYHSDLQPIKLLWARVKGNIARLYSFSTKLKTTVARLEKEFEKLATEEGAAAIGRMIKHAAQIGRQYSLMDLAGASPEEALKLQVGIYQDTLTKEAAQFMAEALELSKTMKIDAEFIRYRDADDVSEAEDSEGETEEE